MESGVCHVYIGAALVVCLNQLAGVAPLSVAMFFPFFTLSLNCHLEDIPIEIRIERGVSLLRAVCIYLEQKEQSYLRILERCKQDYAFVIMLVSQKQIYSCFSCDLSDGFSNQIICSVRVLSRR